MYRSLFAAALASALSVMSNATVAHPGKRFIDLDVIDSAGRRFDTYPARSEAADVVRAYLQAEPGARFRLRVRNPHGERVGVVIAVDGRNIINGQRSELAASEAMYVVGAYRTHVFSGWRTDANHVHAFYFTDDTDSYAGAWGDFSAMGTIAVAVFRERRVADDLTHQESAPRRQAPKPKAPAASSPGEHGSDEMGEAQAGTGFGERQWSQSRRVQFAASDRAVFRHIVKYEWRSALCRRGIVSGCEQPNRLWPELGYAPYPPTHPPARW